MADIKVTTELCEKDRELIGDLTHAIVQLTIQLKGNTEAAEHYGKCFGKDAEKPQAPATAAEPEQPKNEPTEEDEPVKTPPTPPEDEQPKITLSDIQQKVVALSAKDKKTEVRAIIKKYADRVSAIAEEAYVEVWDQLTALEG
jgi:phage I-like protein